MQPIPTWLDAPADAIPADLPVNSRQQALPFNSLTWHNFERLAIRLIRREAQVLECTMYGTAGQEQAGIDVLAIGTDGTHTCYQCKRVMSFGPADIRQAVAKFRTGRFFLLAKRFVLFVSMPLERTEQVDEFEEQRILLQQDGIELQKWDGSDAGVLAEKLKPLPHVVDDFFGRWWVDQFNGPDAAVQLGERLDGADRKELLARLLRLYTALFNQHDPGPTTSDGVFAEYRYRYVHPDVIETIQARSQSELARNDDAEREGAQVIASSGVAGNFDYEARRPLLDWFRGRRFGTVLGEPGFGKSALLRYLALAIIRQDDTLAGWLEPLQLRLLPVWLSFPAFAAAIEKKPSTNLQDYFDEWLHRYGYHEVQGLLRKAIKSEEVLFLIDGLDEVHAPEKARLALDRIVLFVESTGGQVLCTSRPRGFSSLGVPPNWAIATLGGLSDHQISELAERSIALTSQQPRDAADFEAARATARPEAARFVAALQVNARTHQLGRTPLLCHALLQLFARASRLPQDRVAIYSEIINLLLSEHPGRRARAAEHASSELPAEIPVAELRRMLVRLALTLQSEYLVTAATQRCAQVFAEYLHDEQEGLGRPLAQARSLAETLLSTLISRLGILVEKGPSEVAFLHLSIQEFLAAEGMAERTELEQITWVRSIWLRASARDWLLNWFGIQGARGGKKFAGRIAAEVSAQGEAGEFERMSALQLCTELACSDLGLPVVDARTFLAKAATDVVLSAFKEHRTALAKSIAGGAVTSAVRDECQELIRSWMPGRSEYDRRDIVAALSSWRPSEDVLSGLLQGIRDDSVLVRRASAQTLAKVFAQSDEVLDQLISIASTSVSPEVRAAALHSLGANPNWKAEALSCATTNLHLSTEEVVLETTRIRIANEVHDEVDLQRLWKLWYQENVDHSLIDDLYELLAAWKADSHLRQAFVAHVRRDSRSRSDDEVLLAYLVRSYPGDNEVASLVEQRLRKFGLNLGAFLRRDMWSSLREGFRGNAVLVPVLWEAIREYREKHESIFWDPMHAGAYAVIGDEQAKAAVLSGYDNAPADRDRYWIARILREGWGGDPDVKEALRSWIASTDVTMSAPLARWAKELIPDPQERRAWLLRHVQAAEQGIVADSISQLLEEFHDEESLLAVRDRLVSAKIWYYERVRLQALLAALQPLSAESEELRLSAISELDGPPVAPWVRSVEDMTPWRRIVLRAAFPASEDVRMAVASTLRSRILPVEILGSILLNHLSESQSSVRTTSSCALARATRDSRSEQKATFTTALEGELRSSGTYYHARRLTALAAFVEMGELQRAGSVLLEAGGREWTSYLVEHLNPDLVALQVVLSHWPEVSSTFKGMGLTGDLPIDSVAANGGTDLLLQTQSLVAEVEERLRKGLPPWEQGGYLELLARRHPKSEQLRNALLTVLGGRNFHYPSMLTAARLLSEHFGGDKDSWTRVSQLVSDPHRDTHASGVYAYLSLGWPENLRDIQTARLSAGSNSSLDDMVLSSVAGDLSSTRKAAENIILTDRGFWRYRGFFTELFRAWAQLPVAEMLLQEWATSADPSKSMTSIGLLAASEKTSLLDSGPLHARFNSEASGESPLTDGFNVAVRESRSWPISVLGALLTFTR
jgi:hypothetical protein